MDYSGTTLSWRHHDDAVEVELHRAPLNEIGMATLEELERLAAYVQSGASGARALIFWSSRPGFCAGADLRELHAGFVDRREQRLQRVQELTGEGTVARGVQRGLQRVARPLIRREIRSFIRRIHAVMDTLDHAPMTTIAATHGVVFGGGFELALTADLIVAEKSSRFCFPELRLGIVPGFGGVPRLERDLGNALVRDLLLTGRSLNARRAQAVGLVSQVAPKGEGLEAARRIAAQASKFDPYTTARAKAFLKPLPTARLEEEQRLFCELVLRPEVFAALERFVADASPQPYLP